jgi:hypothetical protein
MTVLRENRDSAVRKSKRNTDAAKGGSSPRTVRSIGLHVLLMPNMRTGRRLPHPSVMQLSYLGTGGPRRRLRKAEPVAAVGSEGQPTAPPDRKPPKVILPSLCSSQDPPRFRTHAAPRCLRCTWRISSCGYRTKPQSPCASILRSVRRAPKLVLRETSGESAAADDNSIPGNRGTITTKDRLFRRHRPTCDIGGPGLPC